MGCTYEFMGKLYTKEQLVKLLQDKGTQNKIKILQNQLNAEQSISLSPEEDISAEFTDDDFNFEPFEDVEFNESGEFTNVNSVTEPDMVLDYKKLVQFKTNLLNTIKDRIANLNSFISTLTDKNKVKENIKLLKELQERAAILDQEIYNEKNAGSTSLQQLKFQADNDFKRLNALLSPNQEMTDTHENLKEAKKILNFYKSLELVKNKIDVNKEAYEFHPFFNLEEILGEDGKPIFSEEIANIFNGLAQQFKTLENQYHDRQRDLMVKVVNANPKVKTVLGEKTYDEIMANLEDATWLDMMIMEANRGIFSSNGLIPQVSLEILQDNETESISKHKQFEEKHNQLLPKVRDALKRLNKNLFKGVSYKIFFQQILPGKTGIKLVNRFAQNYFDAISSELYYFRKAVLDAKSITEEDVREKSLTRAYEDKQNWFRENTMMLDVRKLPEIAAIFPEFELDYEDDGGKHKAELIEQIGEIGYREELKKQVDQLKKYVSWRDSIQEIYLEQTGVDSIADLNEAQLNELKEVLATENPFSAASYFYDDTKTKVGKRFVNHSMNYNITIPRKYKAKSVKNKEGKIIIVPTDESTGYYDENYQTIESDPDLKAYYDLISKRMDEVGSIFPEEIRKNLLTGSLPLIRQTVAEILSNPDIAIFKRISKALYQIYENIKLGFGVNVNDSIYQSDETDALLDKAEPKVNASFLNNNKELITDRFDITRRKLNNELKKAGIPLKVNRYTEILTDALPYPAMKLIADKLGIPATTDALKAKFGDKIKVGDVLYKLTVSEIAQESSLDLPKIIKYYSLMGAEYEARQKSLPLITMLKEHYKQIKTKAQTDRTNALTQFEAWFNRAVIGTTKAEKYGVEKKSTLEEKKKAKDKMKAFFKGRLLTSEEETRRRDINKLIDDIDKEIVDSKSPEEVIKLQEEKTDLIKKREALGKRRATSAGVDALLNHVRFLGLGYKLTSMVTNFLEGQLANMTIAATGDYFEPKHYYRALHIVKGSVVKNATFGKYKLEGAQKTRIFVDRFDILQDSSNELQKASEKTPLNYVEYISPYTGNKRVEYLNQTPLMVAIMLDTEIVGKNGAKSSLWDALNADGKLKPEFATEENIQAWELGLGEKANEFKKNVSNAIVTAHGNYDRLRGIMAKESIAGKIVMMFKTWMGSQLYQRLAVEQDDLSANAKGYKGRYRSHTKSSAALQGAIIGGILTGGWGAGIGAAAGFAFASYKGKAVSELETTDNLMLFKESMFLLKALVRKSLGTPINLLAGREVIKEYSNYDKLVGNQFTERDKKNMRALIAEMSFQLSFFAFGLLVKNLYWDDDDEDDSEKRKLHNVLMNYTNQLINSSTGYLILPTTVESFVGRIAILDFLNNCGKFVKAFGEYNEGNKIGVTGSNQGEVKMLKALEKITLPAIATQDIGGFETLAERQFEPTFYDDWFWDDEKKARNIIQQKRAELKTQLEKEGLPEEEIKKLLDKTLKLPKDIKDPDSRTATKNVKKPKTKLTEEQKQRFKELEKQLKEEK